MTGNMPDANRATSLERHANNTDVGDGSEIVARTPVLEIVCFFASLGLVVEALLAKDGAEILIGVFFVIVASLSLLVAVDDIPSPTRVPVVSDRGERGRGERPADR
jgi:hypothetical protein